MTISPTGTSIPQETLTQVRLILEKLFRTGQQWVKGISTTDWRRLHYVSPPRRARQPTPDTPSVAHIVADLQPLLGYLGKAASDDTASTHNYIVVKAEGKCLSNDGIALLRPVLKTNFDNNPQLNFHIWFHCMSPGAANDHLMVGWRLEAPEGGGSTHDFFHAQPLRKYGAEETLHGLHARFSDSFPTIPLPASNAVELCLTAVLVACGKEALREFTNNGNPAIRATARAFWGRVFGDHTATTARATPEL